MHIIQMAKLLKWIKKIIKYLLYIIIGAINNINLKTFAKLIVLIKNYPIIISEDNSSK